MTPDPPLSKIQLLRITVMKEIRTTFRERSQIAAVLVAVAMLVVVMMGSFLPAVRSARSRSAVTRPTTTRASTEPTTAPAVPRPPGSLDLRMAAGTTRWVAIGVASFIGFFFSCGYLFAAVLATFVGEKEGRTLEVLLACPMSDLTLYLVKCFSVLLPSAALAAAFAAGAIAIAAVALSGTHHGVPVSVLWSAPPLAIPLVVLLQVCFVGLGAAISARTETMKGAGQVLGVLLLLLIFGSSYGLPAVVAAFPPVERAVQSVAVDFLGRPFPIQYVAAVMVAAVPAVIFLLVGRAFFRRDRMLT
jgi:ABC-type Na+ efflux pump permease subunit